MHLRAFNPDSNSGDADRVSKFSCASPYHPKPARDVQHWIRRDGPKNLKAGNWQGLLAFDDDQQLIAISIYEPDEDGWFLNAIAICTDLQGQGLGLQHTRRTLDWIVAETGTDSISAWWKVHVKNTASLGLNVRLGADGPESDPDDDNLVQFRIEWSANDSGSGR